MWLNFKRAVDKLVRTAKKITLQMAMTKKIFTRKKIGVTPSVSAPGATNPSA